MPVKFQKQADLSNFKRLELNCELTTMYALPASEPLESLVKAQKELITDECSEGVN